MARKGDEYNWLDDPFSDRKTKLEQGGPSKGLLGVGCLVAFGLMVAFAVISLSGLLDLASSF